MTTVRPVTPRDHAAWLHMRCALWPEGSEAEHSGEMKAFFDGRSEEPLAVLIAESGREILGFAELSIRAFAEGCTSQGVAYLEGWFVVPHARGKGVGRALTLAAEEWARSRGCSEIASDTEAENEVSIKAHTALGFEDVALIKCFRKRLAPLP